MGSFVVTLLLEAPVEQRVRERPVVGTPRHSERFELPAVAVALDGIAHRLVRRTMGPERAESVGFAPRLDFVARPAGSAEWIEHEDSKNQLDLPLRIPTKKSCDEPWNCDHLCIELPPDVRYELRGVPALDPTFDDRVICSHRKQSEQYIVPASAGWQAFEVRLQRQLLELPSCAVEDSVDIVSEEPTPLRVVSLDQSSLESLIRSSSGRVTNDESCESHRRLPLPCPRSGARGLILNAMCRFCFTRSDGPVFSGRQRG